MIENSNNDAASELWDDVGGASGVARANVRLGLRHTAMSLAWGLTDTTACDQLTLLSDLISAHSPLSASSRSYELGLMREVEPDQAWGVTAAATRRTSSAVKNGWLPDPKLWVINSVGVIHHAGHVLLVAVLSDDQLGEGPASRRMRRPRWPPSTRSWGLARRAPRRGRRRTGSTGDDAPPTAGLVAGGGIGREKR